MRNEFNPHPGEICFPGDFYHENILVSHFICNTHPGQEQQTNINQILGNSQNSSDWRLLPTVVISLMNGSCTDGSGAGCDPSTYRARGCYSQVCPTIRFLGNSGAYQGCIRYNRVEITQFVEKSGEVYAYFPFCFSDEGFVIPTYRELFGMEYHQAEINFSQFRNAQNIHQFGMNVFVCSPRDSLMTNPNRRLFDLTPLDSTPVHQIPLSTTGTEAQIKTLLQSNAGSPTSNTNSHNDYLSRYFTGQMQIVSLRQFRSGSQGKETCLQNIQFTRVNHFHMNSGGYFNKQFNLNIPYLGPITDFHYPIRKIGFNNEMAVESLQGIWMNCTQQYGPAS